MTRGFTQERIHIVLRVEHNHIGNQGGVYLVVAVLEVPFFVLPHWVHQLVLVEVNNLKKKSK